MGYRGVDLDATLAFYEGWQSDRNIGEPIPEMLERVKGWLADGDEVRIITARVAGRPTWPGGVPTLDMAEVWKVRRWCQQHLGQMLAVQFWKDSGMYELWDDRAIQVIKNTGIPVLVPEEDDGTSETE